MAFEIDLNSLGSRQIRREITGETGLRQIDDFLTETQDDQNNFFQPVLRFTKSVLAFFWEKASDLLRWSFTEVWGGIVSGIQFIWTFNFGASDSELDAQIEAGWNSLIGTLGGTLGNAAGWLTCGGIPGTFILTLNETLGLYLLQQVGEEALDELAANTGNLTSLLFQQLGKAGFIWLFKKIRKTLYPNVNKFDPWSFATAYQNWLEDLNPTIANFIEEFFEEFFQSCVESGYVIAGGLDSFFFQQRLAPSPLGPNTTLEVEFNRAVDSTTGTGIRNRVLIHGKSELAKIEAVNRIEQNLQLAEIRAFRQELPASDSQTDKPLIIVNFSAAHTSDIEPGGSYHQTEVSFRAKESCRQITPAQIQAYALRTKDEFAIPPFIWKKGKKDISYQDPINGIAFRRYACLNEAEGRKLISALTNSALGVNPVWAKAKFYENLDEQEAYDDTPPDITIAGQQRPGRKLKPIVELRPRSCQIVFGSYETHTLWDLTGKLPRSIYTIDVN